MKALLRSYPDLSYEERKQKAFDYIVDEAFSRMGVKTLKIFDAIEATGHNLRDIEYYITYCKNSVRKKVSEYYKSNRKPNIYVSALRTNLMKEGTAIWHDEFEADDLIADRAKELRKEGKEYIVVSIDKDLKQIAGLHFDYYPIYAKNPETGEKLFVRLKGLSFTTPFESAEMLALQMLMGDSGDRVKGLSKVGPKTAEKLLKDCQTPYSLFRKVVSEYIKRHDDNFDWRIELMRNFRLIKLGKKLEL
jgi:5'-3' exonuclease